LLECGDGDVLADVRSRLFLKGNLAAMLTAAQQTKRSPETGALMVQMKLVAGLATSGTCSCGVAQRSDPERRLSGAASRSEALVATVRKIVNNAPAASHDD
jgi:hypothetical protein